MTLLEKKAALGKAIDDLRTANKLSVAEFSKTIGIPVGTIKKWQSGDNTPNIFNLEKIADVYCLDIDYLLGRKTDDILRMDQLTEEEKHIVRGLAQYFISLHNKPVTVKKKI